MKNAVFNEQFRYTFHKKKNIKPLLASTIIMMALTFLAGPLNNISHYVKEGTAPQAAITLSIAAILITLTFFIRKASIALEDEELTLIEDWLQRSPLSTGQVFTGETSFAWLYAIIQLALFFPMLMIGFAVSGAENSQIIVCMLYLLLFLVTLQSLNVTIRSITERNGVFLFLWILVLLAAIIFFAIFQQFNPVLAVSSIFTLDQTLFPVVPLFGTEQPVIVHASLFLIILLISALLIFYITLTMKAKGN